MDRRNLKIGIFASKFLNYKFETYLKEEGYYNIYTFTSFCDSINNLDLLFIDEEYFERYQHLINNTLIFAILTSTIDKDRFLKYIRKGAKSVLLKSADKDDFTLSLETLLSFKELENKIIHYAKELQQVIKYKDKQEDLALNKQLKIIKDDVNMKFFKDKIVSIYFQPKDILSGDSYFAIRVNNSKTFFCIVDSMGKGLSASLTAMLSISFLSYLFETIHYNFETYVKKTIDYVKTILLKDEALCIMFVECGDKKVKYVNFSMPPIYIKNNNQIIKLRPNNLPLIDTFDSQKTKIDEYKDGFDMMLMLSDGILEKEVDDTLLFTMFPKLLQKHYFLNDLIKEINQKVKEFDDDITMIAVTKDNFKYKKIFEKEYYFQKKDVDVILRDIQNLNLEKFETISLILIELLLNIFEHQKDINKEELIKKNKPIENEKTYVKISVFLSKEFIKFEVKENKRNDFNISEIFKQERLKKYSGRGILMVNFFTSATAYSPNGDMVKFFIRRENGI